MKLRVLGFLAVLALVPVGLRAQVPPCCIPLTQAQIDNVLPLLQQEAGAKNAFWWDQRAARGMTKTDYVAIKNALMVARLDATDAARLKALPFDDGSRAARNANALLYRSNVARVGSILGKLQPEPGCALCSSPPPASNARTR